MKANALSTRQIRVEETTYSVHTNAEALRLGENNIAEIGRRLHDRGTSSSLSPSSRRTMT
jgi:hypothetical protein